MLRGPQLGRDTGRVGRTMSQSSHRVTNEGARELKTQTRTTPLACDSCGETAAARYPVATRVTGIRDLLLG